MCENKLHISNDLFAFILFGIQKVKILESRCLPVAIIVIAWLSQMRLELRLGNSGNYSFCSLDKVQSFCIYAKLMQQLNHIAYVTVGHIQWSCTCFGTTAFMNLALKFLQFHLLCPKSCRVSLLRTKYFSVTDGQAFDGARPPWVDQRGRLIGQHPPSRSDR